MRLNFSSSTEEEIREGVRRIGKIVAEQVALYDTLTGHRAAERAAPAAASARRRRSPTSCSCRAAARRRVAARARHDAASRC